MHAVQKAKSRQRQDIGRIGSVNAQVLFMDSRHRVWTSSDYGRLIRYDPERDRLETSPYIFGDAVTGRDGQMILGEDYDLGHLWLYFPRIQRYNNG